MSNPLPFHVTEGELSGADWRPVESSNVQRLTWIPSGERGSRRARRAKDPDRRVIGSLYVEFKGGTIGHYDDVPEGTLERLCEADSVGRALHQEVKPNYLHRKVQVISDDGKENAHERNAGPRTGGGSA